MWIWTTFLFQIFLLILKFNFQNFLNYFLDEFSDTNCRPNDWYRDWLSFVLGFGLFVKVLFKKVTIFYGMYVFVIRVCVKRCNTTTKSFLQHELRCKGRGPIYISSG